MSAGAKPPETPTDFTIGFEDGTQLPVGYVVIDPLTDNYKKYEDIAILMKWESVVRQPLWLSFIDFEYGIQDNIQHNYDEVKPYMRSEPFRFYSGSDNLYLEMMVRFFAFKSARTEVHAQYEFLKALQYPWVDIQTKYKYPPPKSVSYTHLTLPTKRIV